MSRPIADQSMIVSSTVSVLLKREAPWLRELLLRV